MNQEQLFLDKVIDDINLKINEVISEKEKLGKEIESFGIAEKEDSGTIRKLKEKHRSCDGKVFKLNQRKDGTHFGRMDLILTESDLQEKIIMYIGERSYSDINNKILIYDWRSPVCNLYYMSNQNTFKYNESNYELELKRQINIKNQVVTNIYDLFIKGKNIDITDSFLLQVLEEKKSRNEFSDIIKTIQANQNNIIRDDLYSNTVVQGVAGSGKTVVLLHRISYLLYNNPNINSDNIIFITPSKVFASKLFKINRSLELNKIRMLTIEEYYLGKIKTYLPKIKINEIINDNYDETELLSYVYSDELISLIKESINIYVNSFSSLNDCHDNYYQNLFNENRRLNKLEWSSLEEKDLIQKQVKNNSQFINRDVIKKIMDIIYDKLNIKFRLKQKNWIRNNKIYHYQAYILLQIYKIYGFNYQINYKYMFIDEMQDYANNEFKLLYYLEKKPYFNLYGDVNQNIKDHIPGKDINSFIDYLKEELDINTFNKYELIENYRNTKQVVNYCNSFLPFKILSMGIDSVPIIQKDIAINDVLDNIINNYQNNEVVILANDKMLLEGLKKEDFECYSIIDAKGLEFSKVLVIEDGLNLTEKYIAYTRTLDSLIIYHIK